MPCGANHIWRAGAFAELEQISDPLLKAADINQDGFLEIEDATLLQMFLAEYEMPYPVGEAV